jgi:hypothetical protein
MLHYIIGESRVNTVWHILKLRVRNTGFVASNILNKKLQTADRRGSFSLGSRLDS